MSDARVTLGRIAGVFGIRGWVKVQAFTRPPENVFEYGRWWLVQSTGAAFETDVVDSRAQGRGFIAQLTGADGEVVEDRDAAAALVGAEIQVPRDALPPAPPGQYYWTDLMGLSVEALDGTPLGTVESLTDNGAQDVLVVRDSSQQRLIPFVQGPIVHAVDLAGRRIVVDWAADY